MSFQLARPLTILSTRSEGQSAKQAPVHKTKLYPPAQFLSDSRDVQYFLLWKVRGSWLALFTVFIAVLEEKRGRL